MFLGLPDPDPDPFVRGMDPDPAPDPSVIMQENYVNVPSTSNKQKKCLNKNCFCWHLEGQ
jgi:hypothetical protein